MPAINVAKLSLKQLTYAVGIAEAAKGVFTTDELVAGCPESLTERGAKAFAERWPELNTKPVPPFLQDRNGTFFVWGPGWWEVGTFNEKTGLPWVCHGPGGEFNPLKDGVYILEREKITTTPGRRGQCEDASGQKNVAQDGWTAWSIHSEDDESEGQTLLEAGLRCYVHSVFGEQVNLPDNVL